MERKIDLKVLEAEKVCDIFAYANIRDEFIINGTALEIIMKDGSVIYLTTRGKQFRITKSSTMRINWIGKCVYDYDAITIAEEYSDNVSHVKLIYRNIDVINVTTWEE